MVVLSPYNDDVTASGIAQQITPSLIMKPIRGRKPTDEAASPGMNVETSLDDFCGRAPIDKTENAETWHLSSTSK